MKTRVFKKNARNTKLFLWAMGLSLLIYVLNLIFKEELKISNSVFLLFYSILFGIQYFVAKSWYVKTDKDRVQIWRNLIPTKVLYTDILSHRILVTGDIELKLEDKEIEISKDVISSEDFEELKEILNQLNQ